ncbi:MAG TPA: hypothetical protein VG326_05590 [Tepidisphaeraceae bacterium]|jgi:hypothetical protein|nr:hypothetical protein [Tepidisphaeraceae bacterium]
MSDDGITLVGSVQAIAKSASDAASTAADVATSVGAAAVSSGKAAIADVQQFFAPDGAPGGFCIQCAAARAGAAISSAASAIWNRVTVDAHQIAGHPGGAAIGAGKTLVNQVAAGAQMIAFAPEMMAAKTTAKVASIYAKTLQARGDTARAQALQEQADALDKMATGYVPFTITDRAEQAGGDLTVTAEAVTAVVVTAGVAAPAAAGVEGTAIAVDGAGTAIAADAVTTENVSISVIGHYPDYVNMAQDLRASYFSVPTEQWNAMSETEQWAANQKFLDDAIARGETFRLATPLDEVRPGSFLEDEVNHLTTNGYQLNSDGTALVPRPKN